MTRNYANWQEYQEEVASFFRRQGYTAEVEKRVKGVRAEHKIDVYVSFSQLGIESKWAVECKLWKTPVTKEKVLALKSLVEDIGADRGFIFSEKGFQSGANDAAFGTNILLISSLEEFERTALTTSNKFKLVEKPGIGEDICSFFQFPLPEQPRTLLNYEDLVFVGNWHNGNIALLDPTERTIEKTIALDNYESITSLSKVREIRRYVPGKMAISGGKLFIGQIFSDFILAVDIETGAIIKRIEIAGGGEGELTSSSDGRYVYFASNKIPQFFEINSATYEHTAVPYPKGGRGVMGMLADPKDEFVYLGIQRGGNINGKTYPGGNSFLAVYDLRKRKYIRNIYLAEILDNRSDDSSPSSIIYDESANQIFVGMFQSRKGIYRIDAESHEIIDNISFEPNEYNEHFPWVDPLSQVLYREFLLSINRNNRELAVIKRNSGELLRTVFLGDAPNGPNDLLVFNDEAIISYPALNGLLFLPLQEILAPNPKMVPIE